MRKVISAVLIAAGLTFAMPQNAQAMSNSLEHRAYYVAKAQLGDRYQYGAEGPSRFDCSGLTWYSYRHAGKHIPRTTRYQFSHTVDITWRQRHYGDLIFFSHKGTHDHFHVGIYAGHGYMIHANAGSYYGRKVIKEKMANYWYKHYNADYRHIRS